MLPPGFVLQTEDYDFGLAYYAAPSIVQVGDTRYQDDPKGLYFERLQKLRSTPMEHINTHIPVGALPTNPAYRRASFPVTCERIMLRHVDCHDGCWLTLCNADFTHSMNTQDEVDDVRPIRFTKSMMVPILRSLHSGIYLGHGVASGNSALGSTYNGWGTAMFQRLPADW